MKKEDCSKEKCSLLYLPEKVATLTAVDKINSQPLVCPINNERQTRRGDDFQSVEHLQAHAGKLQNGKACRLETC